MTRTAPVLDVANLTVTIVGGVNVVIESVQVVVSATPVMTLTLTNASIALNFAKPGADTIKFGGTLSLPANFSPNDATADVNVGGVTDALTLNAKGLGINGTDSIGIRIDSKAGVVSTHQAKFGVLLKKGSFAATLASVGLDNANEKAQTVVVSFSINLNGTTYGEDRRMSYTAKKGKSGAAK